ncbi:L-histidine N(alpha)-methyltransferase [Micavibrio aeruginosavorus]|uniref:L-histidine N(alpha)-methyltransferase n=1 Tax=Micavibrio aeruginosavorus TaxID=349221 RepID=UPI003F4ADC4E
MRSLSDADILHALRKKEENRFLNDSIDLFSGYRTGHMNPYAFNEPQTSSDPVRGGEHWGRFVNTSRDYYLISEEAQLIQSLATEIGKILPKNALCVDLGPGEEKAVITKTFPILTGMSSPSGYVAVDVNNKFIHNASALVQDKLQIESSGILADFFEETLSIAARSPKVMVLFGGLLCNLGRGKASALLELSNNLKKLRKHAQAGDYLVITQDINQNQTTLDAAYNHPDLARYIMTLTHRIKRDLPTRDFNPDHFEFYSEWDAEEHVQVLGARAKTLSTFQIADHAFAVRKDKKIPLVNCYKFPAEFFLSACRSAGFNAVQTFHGTSDRIILHVLKAT